MAEQITLGFTEADVTKLIQKTGGDVVQAQAEFRRLQALRNVGSKKNSGKKPSTRKDEMPVAGRPGPNEGRLYQNGPFSYIDKEITSHVVSGGSSLMQWVPTRDIKSRFEHVAHLDWIGAKGFDASQETYPEWLAAVEIGACGYGPTTTWNGFKWQASGGTFSWTTDMMKLYEDSGIHYHEEQPIYTFRNGSGPIINGQALRSDKDWAVARVLFTMESHLEYILRHGDEANSQMEWDGLDKIVRPGYIQSRVQGNGVAHWANPLYVNGAGLTIPQLLQTIRVMVRRIRRRISDRNWSLNLNDMIIYMPQTMWDNLAEYIAAGGMFAYTNQFGFDGKMNFSDYRAEYNAVRSGGMGFGTITVDGFPVPVMVDGMTGVNTTITTAGPVETPAIAGDVYILTRRINGMAVWEQQYINWSQLDYPNWSEDRFTLQNGLVRAGWVTESNKCYYYFAEMGGRMVCYMMPIQGRITNVTIPTLDNLENESGMFWNPDFYASRELGQLYGVDSTVP